MSLKSGLGDEISTSRQDSWHNHKQKEQPEIPAYLRAVTGAEEINAVKDDEPSQTEQTSLNNSPSTNKGAIVITMERSSIFAVFMGAALLAITSFAAGLLSYNIFFPTETPKAAETKAAPKILSMPKNEEQVPAEDESKELAEEALSLAELFETPEVEEALESTGVSEVAEGLEEAGESVEEVTEVVPGIGTATETVIRSEKAAEVSVPTGTKEANEAKSSKPANQKEASTPMKTVGSVDKGSQASSGEKSKSTNPGKKRVAAKEKSTPETKVPDVGYYTVNLGEASTEELANAMKEELKTAGIETFVSTTTAAGGRLNYNIRYGKFSTYNEARSVSSSLPKPYSIWGKVEKDESKKQTKKS